jgi:uncharacterized membrane protein
MRSATASELRARLTLAAPTHPMWVHFTIALSVTAFCSDLLAALFGIRWWMNLGWWLIAADIPVTVTALATGLKARLQLPLEEGAARSFLRVHMALGPTVLGCLVLMGCWRGWLWQVGSGATAPYLVALAAVLLAIAVQGYLGGELVYRYGAGVRGRYRQLPGHTPARSEAAWAGRTSEPRGRA